MLTQDSNRWHRVSETYWMCLMYDVWREGSAWRTAWLYDSTYPQTFPTPRAAMSHCDRQSGGEQR